jgi:hypothetical protein
MAVGVFHPGEHDSFDPRSVIRLAALPGRSPDEDAVQFASGVGFLSTGIAKMRSVPSLRGNGKMMRDSGGNMPGTRINEQ